MDLPCKTSEICGNFCIFQGSRQQKPEPVTLCDLQGWGRCRSSGDSSNLRLQRTDGVQWQKTDKDLAKGQNGKPQLPTLGKCFQVIKVATPSQFIVFSLCIFYQQVATGLRWENVRLLKAGRSRKASLKKGFMS